MILPFVSGGGSNQKLKEVRSGVQALNVSTKWRSFQSDLSVPKSVVLLMINLLISFA